MRDCNLCSGTMIQMGALGNIMHGRCRLCGHETSEEVELVDGISEEELLDIAMECVEDDSNEGICMQCGNVQDCVEPDAEGYKCDDCGAFDVNGAEQVIIKLA